MPIWVTALLRSKLFWGAIIAAGLLAGANLVLSARYDAGLKAGRSECRSAALQARLDESERLRLDAEKREARESGRADAALEVARTRAQAVRTVVELAQAQPNAKAECLSRETTDAIRQIR